MWFFPMIPMNSWSDAMVFDMLSYALELVKCCVLKI